MEFVFTVGVVVSTLVILLTVNAKNKRKIRNLRNRVFELEQLLNMALIYGKETEENEARAREENCKKSEESGKKSID